MISTCIDGKVLDWSFKKIVDGIYNFYIGNIYIGQIIKQRRRNWHSVSCIPRVLSPGGFRSRYAAAEYAFNIWNGEEVKKNLPYLHHECYRCTPAHASDCKICHDSLTMVKQTVVNANIKY